MKRERQFKMLLSAQEHRALQWLADQSCHTASSYLRSVITEAYRDQFQVPKLRKEIQAARDSRLKVAS